MKHGVNGYLISPADVGSLTKGIERLLLDEAARKRMGIASRSIIARWSYEECRQGLRAALTQLVPSAAIAVGH